jgi:hypothetical protein
MGNVTGNTVTWVLGNLSPGDLTVSFTVRVDVGTPGETVLNNTAQVTSPSASTANASASAKVRGDVQVTIGVYNNAGELVRTFPVIYLSEPINELNLTSGGVISTAGEAITMTWAGGRILGAWDGTGQNGQLVANGVYFVKVDSVDSYGDITSVTKTMTVNRRVIQMTVTIFNQAGEVVRHLYSEQPATDAAVQDMTLSTTVIHPGGDGKDGISAAVGIVLSDGVATVWDGTSERGTYVSDGEYIVQALVKNAPNGTVEITKPIAVLGSRALTGNTAVWPNVVTLGKTLVTLHARVLEGTQRIRASVFTLAGKKAGEVNGSEGQNNVLMDMGAYQSGLYIVMLDTVEGGLLKDRTKLKLVIEK